MPGGWLMIGLAAALSAAAGASILIVIWVVCRMQHKGGVIKEMIKKKQLEKKGSNMIALWPSMNDKFEGSITKRIKAAASNYNNKEPLMNQSSKIASAWRAAYPIKAFHWQEHPNLVADAVEHGWSTFAFSFSLFDSSPLINIPPKLWDSCVRNFSLLPAGDSPPLRRAQPRIAWEVNAASIDYMQKIRLNPDLIHPSYTNTELNLFNGPISTVQSLQTTLPLPGPPLGPLSFPQEGYYEITVFADSFAELSHTSFNDNEHAQLIAPRGVFAKCSSYAASDAPLVADAVVHKRPSSFGISININDLNKGGAAAMDQNGAAPPLQVTGDAHSIKEEIIDVPALQSATNEQQICAIGLAAGCAPPFRLPGSDAASIGFFSNGRVFLNGKEQKKPEGWLRRIWGPMTGLSTPTTVGCGFDPEARRLFFTLNGEMVEEILLPPLNVNNVRRRGDDAPNIDKSMEFTAYPLFPTIGANYSITVTANFGQAEFAYAAANAQRVPNPCFKRAAAAGTKGAGEDSADLFSMGRIDSQWLADLGGGGDGGATVTFGSPARGNGGLGRTGVAHEPANPTSEVVEGDLFEITLESRTLSNPIN